ncbi:gibberellin 20-oxidase, putative [Talaromyces stipitatus ATCC 10500]|uniref:Gibberellin 20-oxidase, putative n=1 Tax=Talaromyces stipitatus (strain ATCC 10500 / CBS 375.48 / QM 6759 / NRRL 1006) TaxID=441959 RepID=B8MEY5_TALSN|nr:gibberellin 20-oxidase, putative [Talaromyces stipitatus ATCC 10500]EED17268.1 gibberellin 20-oxidase, putative [Talaromyces stipitatus ATCC 10500]
MSVPLLDASQLGAGDEARKRFLDHLLQSFHDYGFVRLINHGVPSDRVQEMFGWAKRIFELNKERKLACENIADGSPQRGYSAIGAEKTAALFGHLVGHDVDANLYDAREHFDCGSPNDAEYANRWPEDLPGFQPAMESFYALMADCTRTLIAALEEALHVPQGTLNGNISSKTHSASELRLNHYPPIAMNTLRTGQVSRIWLHFDLGVITLLFASSVGGLEVEDRNAPAQQTFIAVNPESEAELVVNISETLQRWTNDELRAGLHRVSFPTQLDQNGGDVEIPARYSIAYFCKADRQASLGSLPAFTRGTKPLYPDITALEYHRSRLQTAY